jgi:hypothetical protein
MIIAILIGNQTPKEAHLQNHFLEQHISTIHQSKNRFRPDGSSVRTSKHWSARKIGKTGKRVLLAAMRSPLSTKAAKKGKVAV